MQYRISFSIITFMVDSSSDLHEKLMSFAVDLSAKAGVDDKVAIKLERALGLSLLKTESLLVKVSIRSDYDHLLNY
jgi:hypothetical protein